MIAVISAAAVPACAQKAGARRGGAGEELANPVASLISVPLQYNYDGNYGPDDDGSKSLLNIQPVWPFSLGEKWNLITRTIVPIVAQHEIRPGTDESGVGDILQSFFFSPKAPVGGWILAIGPAILYPSASDDVLGGEKWGAGPTALALKQTQGWTYGLLTNHVVSFAGEDDRADISSTFLQPFLTYVTKTRTTLALNTESTYDWENEQWSVPRELDDLAAPQGRQEAGEHRGGGPLLGGGGGTDRRDGFRATFTALFPK